MIEQYKRAIRARQDACPHIAGCNGFSETSDPMGRTSIVWHCFHASLGVIGLCTNCQREFRVNDEDFNKWRNMPCFNKPSAGGINLKPELIDKSTIPAEEFVGYAWEEADYILGDDANPDPRFWTNAKLDRFIEAHKKAYKAAKDIENQLKMELV